MIKPQININDLEKVDFRLGLILSAERVEGSDKLVKLEVDFGDVGKRVILTGLGKFFSPEEFVDKKMPFIVNLEPRKMMGLESQGMIFAVDGKDGPVFLLPEKDVESGAVVI